MDGAGAATFDASGDLTALRIGATAHVLVEDIPGDYTVYASFAGTEGYWPSNAVSAFTVMEAVAPAPTPEPVVLPPTEMYILYAALGIIVAIAIVGVVIVLMLRKK